MFWPYCPILATGVEPPDGYYRPIISKSVLPTIIESANGIENVVPTVITPIVETTKPVIEPNELLFRPLETIMDFSLSYLPKEDEMKYSFDYESNGFKMNRNAMVKIRGTINHILDLQ